MTLLLGEGEQGLPEPFTGTALSGKLWRDVLPRGRLMFDTERRIGFPTSVWRYVILVSKTYATTAPKRGTLPMRSLDSGKFTINS